MRLNSDGVAGGRPRSIRRGCGETNSRRLADRAGLTDGLWGREAIQTLEPRQLLAVDLAYTTLAVGNNALPGGTVTVNSTLTNSGDTDLTDSFSVKFFLSEDDTLDGSDTELGTFDNSVTVPAGGIRGFAFDLTIPGDASEGDRFIIGVADSGGVIAETSEANNVGSGEFFVGNTAPVASAPIIGPFTMTRSSTLTIIELSATDDDGITGSLEVTFWYDVDQDNVLSESTDRLIGTGTAGPSNSFVYSGPVPTFFRAGAGRIFVKAFDGLDSGVNSAAFTLQASNTPLVQSLVVSPAGAITWGEPIGFTATGVSGPDDSGTLAGVRLHRESNGMDGLQADDELVGEMSRDGMTDNWTLDTTVQIGWGAGSTFYAQGIDSMDRTGNAASADVTFNEVAAPTLTGLTGPSAPVRRARELTLTATGVSGTNESVSFYRDSNFDGVFDPNTDQLIRLVNNTDGDVSVTFIVDPTWGARKQRFFAVATDLLGQTSDVGNLQLTMAKNRAPRFDTLTADVSSIGKGGTIEFTANNVRDDDGVEIVEIYAETSGNSRLNINQDTLLGTAQVINGSAVFNFTVPGNFTRGVHRFYGRALDIVGKRSPARQVDIRITVNTRPTIDTFNINKNSAAVGEEIRLLARGVNDNGSIGSVQFFFDSNGNGVFDRNTDLFIGFGNRLGSSRNWRLRYNVPAELGTGNKTFFVMALDNLNKRSRSDLDTVTITA